MTYLGTRPILPDELEQYELHHRARIAIKPGITGMWQVSGRSDITDFEEIVRLDTEYISEWNIGLDIKILFGRSFYTVFLKKQKSYSHMYVVFYMQNHPRRSHRPPLVREELHTFSKFHCPWQPVSPIIDQEVVEPLGVRYSKPGIKVLRILRGQTP